VRRAGDAARTHFTDEIAQAVAPSEALLAAALDGSAADPTPTRSGARRRPTPDRRTSMRTIIVGTGSYAPDKV